jgi:hypothetical protein
MGCNMTQLDQLEQLDQQINDLPKDRLALLLYFLVSENRALDLDGMADLIGLTREIESNDQQKKLIVNSLCEKIKSRN